MSDRKHDDGTAGPRPHGLRQGEVLEGEELHTRAAFLRDVTAKVVEAPKPEKPKATRGVKTK